MKVKKQKTDELVVALKQLKLSDRHSGLSLHTRLLSGCLSRTSNDHSLRSRLTRSLSAVAPCLHHSHLCNSICSFDSTYPSHNMGGFKNYLGKHLTESMVNHSATIQSPPFSIADSTHLVTFPASSDNSPFISSVGRLPSTLPIETVNQTRSCTTTDHDLSASTLRRSIGAELDQFCHQSQSKDLTIPCGKTYMSKATKHPGSSNSGICSRSRFCSHHCSASQSSFSLAGVNRATLPQLHLFRRLYSLIDHPCINLYHTCRYFSCSHVTPAGDWAAAYTPRRMRQQYTRYRHSLGSSGSVNNYFSTAATTATNTEDNSTESYVGPPLSMGISSGFRWPYSMQPADHEGTVLHLNDLIPSTCSNSFGRFRRNSDPEHWQQQQTQQTHLNRAALEENGITCPGGQRTRRFSRSGPVSQKSTDIPPSPSSPLPSPSGFSKSTYLPMQRRATMQEVVRSVSDSGESNQLDAPTFSCWAGEKAWSPAFRFRAPILPDQFTARTDALGLQGAGDCSTSIPAPTAGKQQQPVRSTCDALAFWSLSEPRHAVAIAKAGTHVTSSPDDIRRHSPSVPYGGETSAAGEVQSPREYDSKLGPAQKELCQQSSCDDIGGEAAAAATDAGGDGGDQSATMMSMMMTSDVSVSELAAYMEHMVHIPGRMSEMAQRMYI